MVQRRRVLVGARHYWPTTTDATLRLRSWFQDDRNLPIDITVVTPKLHRQWPEKILVDQVSVQRVSASSNLPFRSRKAGPTIITHAAKYCGSDDVVYFDEPDLLAHAVLTQMPAKTRPSVFVRYAGSNEAQPEQKSLDVLRRATKVLVSSARDHRQLLSIGILDRNVVRTSYAAGSTIERNREARQSARRMLGNANYDLFSQMTDQIVVVHSEFKSDVEMRLLVAAIHRVVENDHRIRVWLVGDGPARSNVYETLRHEGIHRLVLMPGSFISLDEILQSADLCIFPGSCDGLQWMLPTCIRSGIPFLAPSTPAVGELLPDRADLARFTFQDGAAGSLESQFTSWVENPTEYQAAASQLLNRSSINLGGATFLKQLLALASSQAAAQ